MTLVKYEYLRTNLDKDKPYLKTNRILVIPNITKKYKYCLLVKRYDDTFKAYEYFMLMGEEQFDINCSKVHYDGDDINIGLDSEAYNTLLKVVHANYNFDFSYVESEDDYDVWQIS